MGGCNANEALVRSSRLDRTGNEARASVARQLETRCFDPGSDRANRDRGLQASMKRSPTPAARAVRRARPQTSVGSRAMDICVVRVSQTPPRSAQLLH